MEITRRQFFKYSAGVAEAVRRLDGAALSKAGRLILATSVGTAAALDMRFSSGPGILEASTLDQQASTYARNPLGLNDEYDPNGWCRVQFPHKPDYQFQYSAPMGVTTVEDGNGTYWVKRLHTPWKYHNWGPMHGPTANAKGLVQYHAPWTGNTVSSGALSIYNEAYRRIKGVNPGVDPVDLAKKEADRAVNVSSVSERPSLGHCDAGATATGLEVEPNEYQGFGLTIPQEQVKSLLIAYYGQRVPEAPFIKGPDEGYTKQEKAINHNYARWMFQKGFGSPVYNVMLNGAAGFWGRTQFSETLNGTTLEITEFDLPFRLVNPSAVLWSDIGWHPEGNIPVDTRLVNVYQLRNYKLDGRLVRHIAFGEPLPQNF